MKEKISQLLNDYSNELKRLGVYLLIILFIFGLALNVIINKDEIAENTMENLNQVEITTEPYETKMAEEITDEQKPILVNDDQLAIINYSSDTDKEKTQIFKEQEVTKPAENKKETEEKPVEYSSGNNFNVIWPVEGEILTGYELKYSSTFEDYRLHPGLDLKATVGTEVKAVERGKVISVQETAERLVVIELEHENGYITRYAHLEKALVNEGQTINQGDIIGKIGEPGLEETSLGPHLHFEIIKNGQSMNPNELLFSN